MDRDPFTSDSRKGVRERENALRHQSLKQAWPSLIMIPGLLAIMHASAFSLLIRLFLGDSSGLSGGREAPWPGAIALIFLASFWLNRMLVRWSISAVLVQVLTFMGWLGTFLCWILLEPAYRDTQVWAHPGRLVQSEAYLIPPLLISMVLWWMGTKYAADIANISAEEIRTVVQRDWIVLVGSILLAAMVGGRAGDDAILMARLAVPLTLIASLALVAGAEVESTRRLAARRGGQPPGWGRWLRLVGGLAVGVAMLSLLVLAVLSPGALNAFVGGVATAMRAAGWALAYVLLAVVWVIYQVVVLVSRLIEAIFGDIFGPIAVPEMATQPVAPPDFGPRNGESGEWEHALLLRWIALGIALMIVAIVVFRVTRRSAPMGDEGLVDEQRDSVFSADLARQQFRDLFRRRSRDARLPTLDLDRPPRSVRESMEYLQALAVRQGVGRREAETPEDFAARLRAVWPGVAAPLVDFPHRYERIRYGEFEDVPSSPDHDSAVRDWATIWNARKNVQPPKGDSGAS